MESNAVSVLDGCVYDRICPDHAFLSRSAGLSRFSKDHLKMTDLEKVRQDGYAIEYIKSPSEEVQLIAALTMEY